MEAAFPSESEVPEWTNPPGEAGVEDRLRVLLGVAKRHRAPISLGQLVDHLPDGPTWTADRVVSWIDGHPESGQLVAGHVLPSPEIAIAELADRATRSARLLHEAEQALHGPLRPATALTRCVGVSGSVAYGFAEPHDDLDFFVAVRQDSVWVFLLLTFAQYRLVRWRNQGTAHWCFNYVADESDAAREFSTPGDLLFAREALTLRILRGDEYYRGILRSAAWMKDELPRLYAQRCAAETGTFPGPASSTPRWVRLANRLLFPVLAAYLQATGLVRNHRLRREAPERQFSTWTTYRRFMLRSLHYAELRRVYRGPDGGPPTTSGAGGVAGPSAP